jgi:hypothetical protein
MGERAPGHSQLAGGLGSGCGLKLKIWNPSYRCRNITAKARKTW